MFFVKSNDGKEKEHVDGDFAFILKSFKLSTKQSTVRRTNLQK